MYIADRHGEANNKYMAGYVPQKPSKHIMYLDTNDLGDVSMLANRGIQMFYARRR